jgi:dihydroxyacetone kinase-like protein
MQTQRARTVELSDVFDSIVNQMRADRDQINDLDRVDGNGNHGDNALYNFELVANKLRSTRGQDAQTQLMQAASLLQQNGRGQTAGMYAEGLRNAAQQLGNRQGISMDDIIPLLQGLLGGVQRQTDAQPGQGTLMDALMPGIMGYIGSRQSGRSNTDAIMDAIGAAMRGSQQTYNGPAQYGNYRRQPKQSWRDPGAASASSMLQGLFRSITGL